MIYALKNRSFSTFKVRPSARKSVVYLRLLSEPLKPNFFDVDILWYLQLLYICQYPSDHLIIWTLFLWMLSFLFKNTYQPFE